jgi:hypothetical protein
MYDRVILEPLGTLWRARCPDMPWVTSCTGRTQEEALGALVMSRPKSVFTLNISVLCGSPGGPQIPVEVDERVGDSIVAELAEAATVDEPSDPNFDIDPALERRLADLGAIRSHSDSLEELARAAGIKGDVVEPFRYLAEGTNRSAPSVDRQMSDAFAMPDDEPEIEPPSIVTEVVAERCERWARRSGPRTINPNFSPPSPAELDGETA